jgi:hypothetical protein
LTSDAHGRVDATSRGTRSCNNNSVARMIGSAWKRSRIAPSKTALAIPAIVMP